MPASHAILYLNDVPVGTVEVQREGESWSHGRFTPSESFAEFASLFSRWAKLLHAGADTLGADTADELRGCEYELDALHAKLHFPGTDRWENCAQLNVDGQLIEWKRY